MRVINLFIGLFIILNLALGMALIFLPRETAKLIEKTLVTQTEPVRDTKLQKIQLEGTVDGRIKFNRASN